MWWDVGKLFYVNSISIRLLAIKISDWQPVILKKDFDWQFDFDFDFDFIKYV